MSRPPEPEWLINWRELLRAWPPQCCHTCLHFDQSGRCLVFDMPPPEDFAGTVDACEQWVMEVPF